MKTLISTLYILILLLASCAHNETTRNVDRAPSSSAYDPEATHKPQWENDVCVLKGENREQDYVIRFSDIHQLCPQLRDYNPVGVAYAKMKNNGRGVHVPTCTPRTSQARTPASKCWMGFDVFGQSLGACNLGKPQLPCSSCQCNGKSGVAWQ